MYRADPTRPRAVVESCGVRALDARDAAPDRESNKTRDILDAQLQHDAAAVRVDARRRDIKPSSDFLARATVDNQFQHFALAPAQSLERILPHVDLEGHATVVEPAPVEVLEPEPVAA